MAVTAIIPARFASVRYPGKPLLRETGKFLIQHVYERVRAARRIDRCLIATDDNRIADAARSFGAEVAMTRADHPSGTDRIAEVMTKLGGAAHEIVLNVQGDEPEIESAALDQLVERMQRSPECPMGTLACPFPADGDPDDPNSVKIVKNASGMALYFSRARIPYCRDVEAGADHAACLLHIGVYALRRDFLLEFASWPAGQLERIEKLEQLRVLERGVPIAVEVVARSWVGVDTPQDYAAFVARHRARAKAPP